MTRTFGELLAEAMANKGLSDYKLSAAIGLLPGNKVFNNVQIRRLRTGERQNLNHELVERLIEVLDLDPAEAWAAAGLLPPGVTADMLRKLDMFASLEPAAAGVGPDALTHWSMKHQGHVKGLGQLIPFPVGGRAA